jgi:hypothetical protein
VSPLFGRYGEHEDLIENVSSLCALVIFGVSECK